MEGKYNTNIAALALTGSYATMVTMSFVSTEPNANLFAWGQLDFLAGGTGSVVSARLIINGNPAQVITIAAPNNHQQQVVCLGSGVAPAVPGSFVVALQALVSSGSASRLAASVMCFGNHVLSV
jgi:hypothetical protein